jgi:hypothetical protein
MLAQAKWDDTMDDPKLAEQEGKMLERTGSSYVWVFGPHSASYLRAGAGHTTASSKGQTIGSLIANSLRCIEGDTSIGRDLNNPPATQ